jgi:alpha-mannosidase
MRVVSYFDKARGTELADSKRPSGFIYAEEQDEQEMSSWITGRYKKSLNPPGEVKVVAVERGQNLARQKIIFEYEFMNSIIKAETHLDNHAAGISYEVECDWREVAKKGYSIPRLEFDFNLGFGCEEYAYDIPFGVIKRKPGCLEAPGNSFIAAIHQKAGTALMLWSDSKYGYRGDEDCIMVSLLRSSCDPDPYPEFGIHKFRFHVSPVGSLENRELLKEATLLNNPAEYIPGNFNKGVLKTANSLMRIKKGNIGIETVKPAEFEKGAIVLRVYETEDKSGEASIEFAAKPHDAYLADIHESKIDGQVCLEGGVLTFDVKAGSIATVVVSF